jgi:RNA recognition motif-containing protein
MEEDMLRRRVASKTADYDDNYTMASRREQVNTVSPLQGSKIVLSNLQTSVTYDDIVELFGDVGALRRVRVNTPGQAEVTFVNHEDAEKAVEIYHNRQLDGKPMKCTLTTTSNAAMKNTYKLPASLVGVKTGNAPSPDLNLIHKALFLNKKQPAGRKQSFTITMPKKGKDEPEYYD